MFGFVSTCSVIERNILPHGYLRMVKFNRYKKAQKFIPFWLFNEPTILSFTIWERMEDLLVQVGYCLFVWSKRLNGEYVGEHMLSGDFSNYGLQSPYYDLFIGVIIKQLNVHISDIARKLSSQDFGIQMSHSWLTKSFFLFRLSFLLLYMKNKIQLICK